MSSDTRSAATKQAQALVGHRYRCASPFLLEHSQIREFARAVQAYHPAHWYETAAARLGFSAIVAPPTFASSMWQQARREVLERLLTEYHPDRVVHVDQTLNIGRPLLAGDLLNCDLYFESLRHFDSFDVITITGVLTDQHGAPVQTGSATLLASTADLGSVRTRLPEIRPALVESTEPVVRRADRQPRARIDFDSLAVGSQLPTAGATITPLDLANYALAVGYPDPRTLADRVGPAERPALIAPSLLVLALATGYVTSWTRDPVAVTKYWVEFADQLHYLVVPQDDEADGTDIEFNSRVIAVDRRRRIATISMDARSQGRRLFSYATADVRFAPSAPG